MDFSLSEFKERKIDIIKQREQVELIEHIEEV